MDVFIKKGLIKSFIELERFWNDGSPSGFTFKNNVAIQYSPFSKYPFFMLPVFAVGRDKCIQIGKIPNGWANKIENQKLPFPIHPEIIEHVLNHNHNIPKKNHSLNIPVIPTSSSRTVLWKGTIDSSHFIKLHYPKKIGRFQRDLYLYKWLSSLETSRELLSFIEKFPPCFAYLREVSGTFIEGTSEIAGFGVIYREFAPYPYKPSSLLIPSFSLFAKNHLSETQPPLLIRIIQNMNSPLDFFISHFIQPILDSYIFLACKCGLIPENNAQNVLFEINSDTMEVRFVLRDMADIFKDFTVRTQLGLHNSLCTYHTIEKQIHIDFYKRRSFAYDFKCGQYLLKPLAVCFSRGFGIKLEKVLNVIREIAVSKWSSHRGYFEHENTWYAYPKKSGVGRESYIKLSNPEFR